VAARLQETYAGFLEHTDAQIGRLTDYLASIGRLDNTLVVALSDNGASAEGGLHGSLNENRFFNNVPESLEENLAGLEDLGGPRYYNHYPWGWAWAGDTPFRRWKRETYRGGTSDALLVHWPAGLAARGELRGQYVHAIDLVPTVLEALRLEPPTHVRGVAQSPIQGVGFAHVFDDPDAESRHRVQYFEMMGHRSLYLDGWRAVCPFPGPSFAEAGVGFGQLELTEEKLRALDADGWELYHVAEDVAETRNLAPMTMPSTTLI
jgi:arylsulfatase